MVEPLDFQKGDHQNIPSGKGDKEPSKGRSQSQEEKENLLLAGGETKLVSW